VNQYLVGLLGEHISASGSPRMHEQEADAQGLRLIYKLYDFASLEKKAQDLGNMLDAAAQMGFAGLNITHPFKRAVLDYLDELSEGVQSIGAVNTVVFRGGKKIGYNTDSAGFYKAFLEELGDCQRNKVLLLGAGGAGSAVAEALMKLSVKTLFIHDKNYELSAGLVKKLSGHYGEERIQLMEKIAPEPLAMDGLVNATPVGMREYPGIPIPEICLHSDLWLSDIIYFPPQTALLVKARELACRNMNGIKMVVNQAADSFELFTGHKADHLRMLNSLAN